MRSNHNKELYLRLNLIVIKHPQKVNLKNRQSKYHRHNISSLPKHPNLTLDNHQHFKRKKLPRNLNRPTLNQNQNNNRHPAHILENQNLYLCLNQLAKNVQKINLQKPPKKSLKHPQNNRHLIKIKQKNVQKKEAQKNHIHHIHTNIQKNYRHKLKKHPHLLKQYKIQPKEN